jgi:hypothetical protein
MSCPVKYFHSNMQGAPQLTNDWGCMTALLDAVLVNGFNLKSIATLTSTGGVATANISAGHLFEVNQVVLIAGASQSEYNGEVRVLSVTSNAFTYAVTGTPASPATGTITVKAAPLGFEIAFTGTNKRAYRSTNVASNRPYLRVDDGLDPVYTTTYAKYAKVTMAQGMSDINTFVGMRAPYNATYPTRNEVGTGSGINAYGGWYKWYYAKIASGAQADSSAPATYNRPWFIIGDDRGFYLFNESFDSRGLGGKCFTDFESYRSADGFNTILCAQDAYTYAGQQINTYNGEGYAGSDWGSKFPRTGDSFGKLAMCSYLQTGNNVGLSFTSLNTNNGQTASGYSTGIAYPNGPDYSLLLHPTLLKEGTSHLRGKMPGMMWVHNDAPSFNHMDVITGVAGYPGKSFMLVKCIHGWSTVDPGYTAYIAYDLTGPWW